MIDGTRCKRCGRRVRQDVPYQKEQHQKYDPFCSKWCRDMYPEEKLKRGEDFDARTYSYER